MRSLVWFKSDLRVADNPALYKASEGGPCLAFISISEIQWDRHGISPAKRSLYIRQVIELRRQLSELNIPLVVLRSGGFENVPSQILNLVKHFNIDMVFWNQELEWNESECEKKVAGVCAEAGVITEQFQDSCIIDPGLIRNQSGKPYKVFSAFKRAFVENFHSLARPIYKRPIPQDVQKVSFFEGSLNDTQLLEMKNNLALQRCYDSDIERMWPVGKSIAGNKFLEFEKSYMASYNVDRDIPSLSATSRLSPYLVVGALTTRQCIEQVIKVNSYDLYGLDDGPNTWVNELIWREFYRHLIFDFPFLSKHKAFKPETENIAWSNDETQFEKWKTGQTGFPIVDAGMRELRMTGWMHNRVRMITAMFLCKHLMIDWRKGEAYFMSMLIDGDLASNNGGWQWSASTGVDAVPYFRIFNPIRQSQRFDSEGSYIKTFVPELRTLDRKSIHMPSSNQATDLGYALPILDLKKAAAQCKLAFESLNRPRTEGSQHQMELVSL